MTDSLRAPCPVSEPATTDAMARTAARRTQILAAAATCFREHGFHAASIAQISRVAGMSPGHIYHYFANKEAIIAAIIAADLERNLQVAERLRADAALITASVEHAIESVHQKLDPACAALELEIVAEAARNERVAAMLHEADTAQRNGFATTLRAIRQNFGHDDSDAEIAAMCELISALFEGLPVRCIANPDIDRTAIAQLVARFITDFVHTVRLTSAS